MHDLGFEVGYYGHYELGWVFKKYEELKANALKLGVASPEKYYVEGKEKGKANRGKVIDGKKIKQEDMEAKNVETVEIIDKKSESAEAVSKCSDTQFLEKPRLQHLPSIVEKSTSTELPRLLRFRSR